MFSIYIFKFIFKKNMYILNIDGVFWMKRYLYVCILIAFLS